MTIPPSPPPPPRREPEGAQAPGELWGIWSADTRHWQAASFGDNYFAHGTREAAERSATRQQHAGNDVVAALIGVSPAVREQRDHLADLLKQVRRYCAERWVVGRVQILGWELLERIDEALTEIEGGGRVGTTQTEEGEPQ
jgi:hypothetical protein